MIRLVGGKGLEERQLIEPTLLHGNNIEEVVFLKLRNNFIR